MDQKGLNQIYLSSNKQKITLWCSNKKEVITQFISQQKTVFHTSLNGILSLFCSDKKTFWSVTNQWTTAAKISKKEFSLCLNGNVVFFMIVSSDAKSIVRETLLSIVKWVWLFIPFFLLGITFKIVQKSISEHEMLRMITKMGQSICTSEANQ
mgnify:CR=1 FL=1